MKAQRDSWLFFVVIGSVTLIGPASMDSYLPGAPEMAADFDVSAAAVQLPMTTFLIGLAVGQFLIGPISDVHGRRLLLVASMASSALTSLTCALAPSFATLACFRFAQGVTAAAGLTIGRAIVRDLYSGAAAARYLSRLVLIVGLGPILTPLAGSQVLRFSSWRGVFVALSVFDLLITVIAARFLPETLAVKERRTAGYVAMLRSLTYLLGNAKFFGFVLINGFGNGAIIAYIASSPFVLEDIYGASPQLYGFLVGFHALFLVLGAQLNARLLSRRSPQRLLGIGLLCMLIAGVILLAASSVPSAGLAALIPGFSLLMFSWSFIQSNGMALALTDHSHLAGTAAALLGVSQFAIAALVAPLAGAGGSKTVVPMAGVIVACSVVAAIAFKTLVQPIKSAQQLNGVLPAGIEDPT